MEKDPSPLDTLRQLKEWLDAGAITPDEFKALKQKLVFAEAPPATAAPDSPAAATPAPAVLPPTPAAPPVVTPEIIASEPAAEPATPAATEPLPASALPPVAEPPVVVPPIEEPISVLPEELPPSVSVPEPKQPPRPEPVLEPTTVAPVEMAPLLPPITHAPAAGSPNGGDEQEYVEEDAYTVPRKSPLLPIVVVASILALLALVAYLLMDGRDSDRLTSTSRTEADSVAQQPEVGPQTEQIELPPIAAPETIRVAPVAPPVVAPVPVDTAAMAVAEPATASPAPTSPATEAPAVLSESAAKARVESIMQRYYADLQAAPFTASAYFAPQVERFYTMQNTTPAAINAELAKTHFPEFLEGQTAIQAGTLQVGAPVADGSRVVTFVEDSQAFRQSRQERQRTSAQMRVRFDKDFKIVYLRQEKLLKNEFGD
ncbi:SHOCT domain-containing protein [Hymenobacter aerophilus]|uniref:SHOCT domain-containing protein n=1 Tax=Hymenobacter aerophilus TaxID=119644 RepID=UPI0003A2D44A|nr:SHOCT domain-containing protein [Hymenobacter aerophilus]